LYGWIQGNFKIAYETISTLINFSIFISHGGIMIPKNCQQIRKSHSKVLGDLWLKRTNFMLYGRWGYL